jgi:hypothetical protein
LERVASEWRLVYKSPGITAAYIVCDGCLATSGRQCGHCQECDIRACAVRHNVSNCAMCADYPCTRIRVFFQSVPAAKDTLEDLRTAL